MKTNVIMMSTDRTLFNVNIRQETKTGFLSLTDLQEAYSHARISYGWSDKRFDHIISQKENAERIYYLLNEQSIINVSFDTFMNEITNNSVTKTLKKYGAYRTTGARENKSTFCNPYIWVLVAMELNPMLYAKTVTWLTDKLILNRIEAGNFYKDLSRAISNFNNVDFVKVATAINYIVFGRHETGIRNTGNQNQLKELKDLEINLAFCINMGYIRSQDELIYELRKLYSKKYNNINQHA